MATELVFRASKSYCSSISYVTNYVDAGASEILVHNRSGFGSYGANFYAPVGPPRTIVAWVISVTAVC